MSTGIQWTDETWNPIAAFDKATGKRGWFCTRVSEGCEHCYAEKMNTWRGNGHRYRVPNLDKVELRLMPKVLAQPLSWREPRRIFVCSMTDLFLDAIPDAFIDAVFATMAQAPQHTFQVLTKRPERMRDYCRARLLGLPLANVEIGVSAESQRWLDIRAPLLMDTPAAVRFVSLEPLLGPVDVGPYVQGYSTRADHHPNCDGEVCDIHCPVEVQVEEPRIDWVIVGGESSAKARPCDLEWIADVVAACEFAGVPCFVKQLGAMPIVLETEERRGESRIIGHPKAPAGYQAVCVRDWKGGDPAEWPEELRVREFPASGVRA